MLTLDAQTRAGRIVTTEVPVDTSLFTPLQLHPRSGFALGMSGWAQWLREHWIPFPRLIGDRGIGVVIASLDLEYLRPFSFFDADALAVTTAVTARARGNLLFIDSRIRPVDSSSDVVRMAAVLRPIKISDDLTLSAEPGNLDADALAMFTADELVTTGARLRVRAMAADIDATCTEIARASFPFTLHRHMCEAADQWSAIALPDLATELRERLVTTHDIDSPGLTAGLVQPLRRIAMEFRRPAFLLDEFTAECRAYARGDSVAFVHRLTSAIDDEPLAMFVEWFGEERTVLDLRDQPH